jgi:hypothetical protein
MTKSHLRTLMGSCLVLSALAFAPIARSQSNLSSQAQPSARVASMETRSAFATSLETQLRQQGADARIQLDGDRREVLHIEWQNLHRSNIYSLVTSSAAQQALHMGFTSFVFSSGNQRWEYDLTRESMIRSSVQP